MGKKFTFAVMVLFGVLALISVGVGLIGLISGAVGVGLIGLLLALVFWLMSISVKNSLRELSQ